MITSWQKYSTIDNIMRVQWLIYFPVELEFINLPLNITIASIHGNVKWYTFITLFYTCSSEYYQLWLVSSTQAQLCCWVYNTSLFYTFTFRTELLCGACLQYVFRDDASSWSHISKASFSSTWKWCRHALISPPQSPESLQVGSFSITPSEFYLPHGRAVQFTVSLFHLRHYIFILHIQ